MSDFKVYQSQSANADRYPYLLDVQSELLVNLETRIVIPLVKGEDIEKHQIKNLNPRIVIREKDFFAMTQQMAAIPKALLGEVVDQVQFSRIEILNSIDFLITGI